jgi:hypothetical protein
MAAPVSFSRWFGTRLWGHKPLTQGGLTLLHVREDCINVEIEFGSEHLARSMDLGDDGVFPHDFILP